MNPDGIDYGDVVVISFQIDDFDQLHVYICILYFNLEILFIQLKRI